MRVKIFAENVKVYVEISHDSTVNELQTVLDVIYAWATVWCPTVDGNFAAKNIS